MLKATHWRPIRTAPKDGTLVLLSDGKDVWLGWWDETNGGLIYKYPGWTDGRPDHWGEQTTRVLEPTHWQPKPAPSQRPRAKKRRYPTNA